MSLIPPPNAPRAITYQRAHYVGSTGRATTVDREVESPELASVQVSLSERARRQTSVEGVEASSQRLSAPLALYAAVQAIETD